MKGIIASTNVDSVGDRFTKEAILSMIEQSKNNYIRVTYEHDPRKIPIGRIIDTQLIEFDDGNFGIENTFEIFDGNNPVCDDEKKS